ncbi:MAG: hypothetical protein M1833_003084 [Piccolia ochrophora]|nr:MAG: hypothetical protein M1833_003084 [Piccolia ochrophora]
MSDQGNSANTISYETFQAVLGRYDDSLEHASARVSKAANKDSASLGSLKELDDWRLNTLPEVLETREKDSKSTWLEKREVEDLVRWKLSHGTFRPKLTQLVASNSAATIKEVTQAGFDAYTKDPSDPAPSLKKLSQLSGIGPATASLLLSVYDQSRVAFFSDEAYRWILYLPEKGQGWDRPIKYTAKEYATYLGGVRETRQRMKEESGRDVSAADIERVGYILGKEKATIVPGGEKRKQQPEESRDDLRDSISPPPTKKIKALKAPNRKLTEDTKTRSSLRKSARLRDG